MANPHAIENHTQNNDQNIVPKIPLAIVMVPFPAAGHINPLLHLSRFVSAYRIPIHFVATTTHNHRAQTRVHGWDPQTLTNIKFHNLPSPPPPSTNPIQNPDPSGHLELLKSSVNLREPVFNLVEKLTTTVKKIVVIYDSHLPYVVQDIRSFPNVESYCFQSISAFTLYSFYQIGKEHKVWPSGAEVITKVPSFEGCFLQEQVELSNSLNMAPKFNSGDIYNTSRVIEGLFMDLLAKEKCTGVDKNWAIGPFNPLSLPEKSDSKTRHKSLDWLDKQGLNSVIFVSFGSTSSLSNEQIEEIALGLERSEVKFVWVLRDADKFDISGGEGRKIELPEGFEERNRENGIIVRDWAPQLEILGHGSTGGFISHCGWNSCLESISMGVPIATWPMQFDQPRNAFLVTNVLKIGVELKNWDRRNELIGSNEVEKCVRTLMGSIEGDEIRKRVKKLRDDVHESFMEGGVTKKEMDSFIAHISK